MKILFCRISFSLLSFLCCCSCCVAQDWPLHNLACQNISDEPQIARREVSDSSGSISSFQTIERHDCRSVGESIFGHPSHYIGRSTQSSFEIPSRIPDQRAGEMYVQRSSPERTMSPPQSAQGHMPPLQMPDNSVNLQKDRQFPELQRRTSGCTSPPRVTGHSGLQSSMSGRSPSPPKARRYSGDQHGRRTSPPKSSRRSEKHLNNGERIRSPSRHQRERISSTSQMRRSGRSRSYGSKHSFHGSRDHYDDDDGSLDISSRHSRSYDSRPCSSRNGEKYRSRRGKEMPSSSGCHRSCSRSFSPVKNRRGSAEDSIVGDSQYSRSYSSSPRRSRSYHDEEYDRRGRPKRPSRRSYAVTSPTFGSGDFEDDFYGQRGSFDQSSRYASSYDSASLDASSSEDSALDVKTGKCDRTTPCSLRCRENKSCVTAPQREAGWTQREFDPHPQDGTNGIPRREPDIENKVALSQRRTPQRPLKNHEGQELANNRIRDYLILRCEDHGSHFSKWWYQLSTRQRTELLNGITDGTIPMIAASLGKVSNMLQAGGPKFGARVLTDFSLRTILAPCDCENGACAMHDYRDQLLHDIHYYVMCWDIAESADYQFCASMVDKGIFPVRTTDSELKFMEPPDNEFSEKVHRLVQLTTPAPPAALESVRTMVENGYLKEHVPFSYFLLRDSYRLAIYSLLFEQFDQLELGVPTPMPLSRLQGCEYCLQTCEEEIALMCDICTSKWWCCLGCMKASHHGRRCPVGQPIRMGVRFG